MWWVAVCSGAALFLGGAALGWELQWRVEHAQAVRYLRALCPAPPRGGAGARIAAWWREMWLAQRLEADLRQAGLDWEPGRAAALLVAGGLICTVLIRALIPMSLWSALGWAGIIVPLAWRGFLRSRRHVWRERFRAALPGSLRLIANLMRTGRSLPTAIEIAAREAPPPCHRFWERVAQALALRAPLRSVLPAEAARVGLPELSAIAGVMCTLYELGGNLPGELEAAATGIERDVQVRQELRALTAEARTVALMLPGMGYALVLVLGMALPGFGAVLVTPLGLLVVGGYTAIQAGVWVLIRHVAAVRL